MYIVLLRGDVNDIHIVNLRVNAMAEGGHPAPGATQVPHTDLCLALSTPQLTAPATTCHTC